MSEEALPAGNIEQPNECAKVPEIDYHEKDPMLQQESTSPSMKGGGALPEQGAYVTMVHSQRSTVDVPGTKSLFCLSIFTCLCCCPLLGIASIYFSGRCLPQQITRN